MNGLNYDYFNYMNGIPYNYMGDTSYIVPNNTSDPYYGFISGNMFENLYEPYKNYKVSELSPSSDKEALLWQLMQYSFAITDLNLYLDVNPDDKKAFKLFSEYSNIYKELSNKYVSLYGPLDVCDVNGLWSWNNSPWPWEV